MIRNLSEHAYVSCLPVQRKVYILRILLSQYQNLRRRHFRSTRRPFSKLFHGRYICHILTVYYSHLCTPFLVSGNLEWICPAGVLLSSLPMILGLMCFESQGEQGHIIRGQLLACTARISRMHLQETMGYTILEHGDDRGYSATSYPELNMLVHGGYQARIFTYCPWETYEKRRRHLH